jgi:hypothetical protein
MRTIRTRCKNNIPQDYNHIKANNTENIETEEREKKQEHTNSDKNQHTTSIAECVEQFWMLRVMNATSGGL